jgi:predicted PurR-regulated permease PerM
MSAGDLASVLVVLLAFGAFIVLLLAMQSLVASLRELRRSLDVLHDETLPLLQELRATVRDAGAEVDRVDNLLDAAESISATVDSATRLSYLAFRAPLLRFVAFFKGIGRFMGRLFGRKPHARSGGSGSTMDRRAA